MKPLQNHTVCHPSSVAELAALKVPSRQSPERTHALVESHLSISQEDNHGSQTAGPSCLSTAQAVELVKFEFKRFLRDNALAPTFVPATLFLHSERVVPGDYEHSSYVNFLAEIRNASGDFIVLSEHGWSVHREGPAFAHIHAAISSQVHLSMYKLYSFDAFSEELAKIREHGLAPLLGLQPRSYILEESLSAIDRFRGISHLEPCGITAVEITSQSDSTAELLFSTSHLGRFSVSVWLVPNRWFVAASARGA